MVLAINLVRFTAPRTLKTHLFAPLYSSLMVLVLLIMGQQSLNIWIAILCKEAANEVNQTFIVKREGEHLLNAVVDEERSWRENLNNQPFSFYGSLNRLKTLVKDNPNQVNQLSKIDNLYVEWQEQLAGRELLSSSSESTTEGEKVLFNSLRTQIQTLVEREEIYLSDVENCLQQIQQIKIVVNILTSLVIITGMWINYQILRGRVEVPLRKLIEVGETWRIGRMEARLAYSAPDEIGRLSEILNAMAGEVRERQECIEVRNKQLENLICALSHDLRTPLLASRITVDSMLKGAFGPVSDTYKEVFQDYRQGNEDLLKLVEALLNISRYEAGYSDRLNYEPLDWEKIFVKTITQIKTTSTSEFTFNYKIPQSLPTVYADELEIQRVIQNLLDNAVRVSEPNKEISLEVATLGENEVQVFVCDQGSGIAPQDKEQLFHRFVQGQGRRGRSGLGLYLCRQIIEAHGGNIGVESSLGEGSTFWFTLPVATDKFNFQDEQI
ncbi:ATP-binding protein [Dendronalium sp. ChiSLP03b]|uniref:ATP-binding protein n=1 Tax=Dendronalium sp. ChiSLP03b TaxID=3075381 RepID=UPI002AD37BD9|nr:ATP-binding protein [Dendronalium sp. ChiSLP03b]MDZ8206114.1 ATP-binding protein [Dendronalium sp. ChiSLP03b]